MDLVFHVDTSEDELEPYRRLIDKGMIDGFILNAPMINDRRVAFLRRKGIPFVTHGRDSLMATHPYYDIDNFGVGAASAALLHDLGHRRIALVNGPAEYNYTVERARGVRETLAARGTAIPDRFITHGQSADMQGYQAALSLLAARWARRRRPSSAPRCRWRRACCAPSPIAT